MEPLRARPPRSLAPIVMMARLARTLAPNAMRPAGRDWSLHHPPRLLVGRQAPVWGELIDQVRQMLTEASQQLVHAQAGVLAQCIERVAAERIRQILGRDLLVRAGADPGLRDAPMSVVLEFFYDVAEAAAEHAASRSPTEHAAQSAGEEVTQAAAGPCPGATRHAAWLAAKQSAKDIVQPTARSAGTRCAAGRHPLARTARIGSLTAPAL